MFDLQFAKYQDKKITLKIIIGSILAGLGWQMGALTAGTFFVFVPEGNLKIFIYWGLPYMFAVKGSQSFTETSKKAV